MIILMNSHGLSSRESSDLYDPKSKPVLQVEKNKETQGIEIEHYVRMIEAYQAEHFSPFQLKEEQLIAHRIAYLDNDHSLLIKQELKWKKTDCLFSIIKTQFNGLEYIYDIFMGPFVLRVLVLNLNRNSDDGDEDICKEEIGSGGFGSVRAVRISEQQHAIKRIPFKFKLDPIIGYDFQAQSSEQYQLRRCLRQFCVFKICSLLGIGPKLTQSGYDLVCFNNCIQFRMELCETITSKQFYLAHEDASLNHIRQDLFSRLAKLHSLHLVHRDIKPDNLLYSPSRKAFVFGDFGMSLLVRENFNEKTLTSFAGTPSFCGEEMRNLLNGEKGLVNLYYNDFYALEESIRFFQQHLVKQESQISRNSMSYNDQNFDDLSDFENFSVQDHSNGSFRNPTDGAYSSTGQSLINFTTASTQAPKKLATSINHHQAELIFSICRQLQRKQPLDRSKLVKEIYDRVAPFETQNLVESLTLEIITIFFHNTNTLIVNGLKEWKNASRHFGPTNEVTIQLIGKIIDVASKEKDKGSQNVKDNLLIIQEEVIKKTGGTGINKAQLLYYRSVAQHFNFNYSYINYLRHILAIKPSFPPQSPEKALEEADFLAKQFLYFCKGREIMTRQMCIVHYLFMKYFIDHQILKIQQLKNESKDLAHLCYNYLLIRKVLNYEDLYCFILYCLLYNRLDLGEVRVLLHEFIGIYEKNKQDMQIAACLSTLCIKISDQFPEYMQTAEELLLATLERMEKEPCPDNVVFKLELMILYNKKGEFSKVVALNDQIADKILTYKCNFVQWKYFDIVRLNTIGQSYLKLKDYQKSKDYYLQSLQSIQVNYSQQKIHELFQVINNIALIFFQTKQYDQAYKYILSLREILQESDREEFAMKKVYVYQHIITLLAIRGKMTEQDKEVCREMVKLIVDNIFKFVDHVYIAHYKQVIGILNYKLDPEIKYFFEKETMKVLATEEYRWAFKEIYLNINLQMGRYLIRDLGHNQQGLKYLWNYIQFLNNHHYLLTENGYCVYNLFASLLMKSNSYRRAIIFLQSYIFHIPTSFFAAKKRAFYLIYKASSQVNDKLTKYYYEITRNNFDQLLSKNFSPAIQKQKSFFKRRLLAKWFKRV